MKASHADFRQTRFFGSLDGLRALSILGVIWFHSWWGTPYYSWIVATPVLRQGSFGVHVFFVISGFLITTLLLRERERFGKISIRNFYVRRALRIWPLYYATLALYVVLVLLLEHGMRRRNFFHYLPMFLTYTYTWFLTPQWPTGIFNLAWTLATEEQFYAFWPLLLRFFRGAWPVILMVLLVALRVIAGYGWIDPVLSPGKLPFRVLLSVSIAICLGVLLAHALHSEQGFRWLYPLLGRKWSAPAALLLVAGCLYPERVPIIPAFIATAALVGACVIREDNGLSFLLQLRPMAYIGVLSYGMYLLNSLAIHAARVALDRVSLPHPLLIFPLATGLALGAASVSHRYFEAPFLNLKSRFSSERHVPKADPQVA